LFLEKLVPAHGIDHIKRVADYMKKIITQEEVRKPLLCELSAWLHDIGRTLEDIPGESSRKHHEFSYELLRKWFKEDNNFNILSNEDKCELLYSVRYHWNEAADKYDTAWILRDADKLDLFGKVGLKRTWELFKDDDNGWNQNFRNIFSSYYFFKTKIARKMAEKLIPETKAELDKYLSSKIKDINLDSV
ncbi:HD domain-containing protein, partial [Patescibacteria group bacterium]|nr:HD domain-containing protein [Patescibacteria group bacterium]